MNKSFKSRLKKNALLNGSWITIPDTNIIEIFGNFDYQVKSKYHIELINIIAMKKIFGFIIFLILLIVNVNGQKSLNSFYISNQAPLLEQSYSALPLGTIKPKGMLLKMLEIQRDGLTGVLDSLYSVVCGSNNGWRV